MALNHRWSSLQHRGGIIMRKTVSLKAIVAVSYLASFILVSNPASAHQSCPVGMVLTGGFCIQPETPYPRGLNWWHAMDRCNADGLRLCSADQIVHALRAGVLRDYWWDEGDGWYITTTQAEATLGMKGENTVCDVQANINQPNHPQYSVQCQHTKSRTDNWRLTVCCY
jgi:hypothetical protein